MINRCTATTSKAFAKYGARGITVCNRWRLFDNFLSDMGEKPPGTSIDRIDGSKGYEPSNCRWATPAEQSRNRSCVRLTAEVVAQIRARYAAGGVSHKTLGDEFGISAVHAGDIVAGRKWRAS